MTDSPESRYQTMGDHVIGVPPGHSTATVLVDRIDTLESATGRILAVVPSQKRAERYRGAHSNLLSDDTLEVMTAHELAQSVLDAAGLTVPSPLATPGAVIDPDVSTQIAPDRWFSAATEACPSQGDLFDRIEDPETAVATFELLLADRIVPGETGWAHDGRDRLVPSRQIATERLEATCEKVPTVDRAAVEAALDTDHTKVIDAVRPVYVQYLRWCLDRGCVTSRQSVAYASFVEAIEQVDHVVYDAGRAVSFATAYLAARASRQSFTLAVTEGDPPAHHAWPVGITGVADRLASLRSRSVSTSHAGQKTDLPASQASAIARGAESKPDRIWTSEDRRGQSAILEVIESLLDEPGARSSHLPTIASAEDILIRCHTQAQATNLLTASHPIDRVLVGPVEIFRTPPAVFSLAWARIVTGRQANRGWAVILEQAGCSDGDLEAWLDRADKPAVFAAFAADLRQVSDPLGFVRAVADRYGCDSRANTALLEALATHSSTPFSLEGLIETLETGMDAGDIATLPEPEWPAVYVRVGTFEDVRSPVVIHCSIPRERSGNGLRYRPPLGLYLTTDIAYEAGHPIRVSNPSWANLEVLLEPPLDRRRRSIATSAGASDKHLIVVGEDGRLIPSQPIWEKDP